MITNKKLLVLWGIIVVAYAAIMVFTWPGLTVPSEKRQAIYAEYVDAVEASDCHAPDPEILAIAEEFQVTHREAVFSVREGFKADNTADPCGRYYP